MTAVRPRRSVLYMPGSNARALEKARTLPADALILDLEDAVAPDAKEIARRQVVDAVTAGGFGPREVVVRVNALSAEWGAADIEAVAPAGPDAILVPKVDGPDDVVRAARAISAAGAPGGTALWVMMETPKAMLACEQIAAARNLPGADRLSVFVMGTNDLAKETRARIVPGRLPMLSMLSRTLLAARSQGLDILDGVYNALKDADGFRRECEEARDLGFDGKTLIHPDQIAAANAVFAPSTDEIAFARRIIAAFAEPANASKGALQIEGRMVERLHAEMAARTVAIADAIGG